MPQPIFNPSFAYRQSDCYILGTIIELETLSFCRVFLDFKNDPKGRQYDQMTQAARSGVKNLVEGSERLRTSTADALTLIDVGRASLCELREDFLTWLMDRGEAPWAKDSQEAQAVFGVRLEPANYSTDVNRETCLHVIGERRKFAAWCQSEDCRVRANAILVLLTRALRMYDGLLKSHGEEFRQKGGIRERMTAARVEARRAGDSDAPKCPQCGATMRLRHGTHGDFWGCTAYPTCRGTRRVQS